MIVKILKRILLIIIIGLFAINNYSQNASPIKSGKELFEDKCAKCHGKDGAKGRWGAINLQYSYGSDIDLLNTISNGRRFMPSWKKKLTIEEIKRVISYIKILRK